MIHSAEEFAILRTSDDPELYERAAKDSAQASVWLDVIEAYPSLRFWVAQNKTVPLEVLAVLAVDEDEAVRSMVARKRKLSAEFLQEMSRDTSDAVRMAVARHRNVSRSTLMQLAKDDPWQEVRNVASSRLKEE